MPFRKKYKRKPRRRQKRKTGYRSLVSNYAPSGMQTMRTANLRYVEQITLVSTLSGLDSFTFSANNPFDPNITGVGHSAMGFDQWALLYNHYCVLGSKITVKVAPKIIQATSVVGCLLSDAAVAPYSDSDNYQEARKGMSKMISVGQGKPVTVSSKFSARKFFNVKDVKDNFDRLGSDTTSSPAEQAYHIVWVQSKDGLTADYTCIVQIDYVVAFSEPKDLAPSGV